MAYINVDNFDWLNFAISTEDKKRLFRQGALAAAQFLRQFNWRQYQDKIKSNLLHRIKPVMWQLSNVDNMEETLKAFGIKGNSALAAKIDQLTAREKPYNVLWIDDAFTYALPIAILHQLNIYTYTVKTSDEALKLLIDNNKNNDDPHRRIDLLLSDATREEPGVEDPRLRGLQFAEQLANDPILDAIPIIFYANTREDLEKRYAPKQLPNNIKNKMERNTVYHGDFIREVVENLTVGA